MPSITIRNLTKQYNGEDGQAVTALDHIDLHIKDGEFVCIVGPSGCGKSTMLEIVAGLLEKSGGEVLLDDEPVTGPSRDIGVVFQDASLYPWKTVKKNIAFGMDISKVPKAEQEERLKKYIHLMNLDGFESKYPAQLSGGMRQRAGIARALVMNPKVILMDKPFSAVDHLTRTTLQDRAGAHPPGGKENHSFRDPRHQRGRVSGRPGHSLKPAPQPDPGGVTRSTRPIPAAETTATWWIWRPGS